MEIIKNLNDPSGDVYEGEDFMGAIEAIDPEGGDVTYRIVSGSIPVGIKFNPSTGEFYGTTSLVNLATGKKYPNDYTWVFGVVATDGVNITSPVRSVGITVKHIFIGMPSASHTTTQNINENTAFTLNFVEMFNIKIAEADPDIYDVGNNPPTITYTVTGLPNYASFNNGIVTGTTPDVGPSGRSDSFTVVATYGSSVITVNCTLNVLFVNSQAPVWVSPASSLGIVQAGFRSWTLVATDPDGGSISYSSGNLPGWLSISGNILSGTATATLAAQNFSFTINAYDGSFTTPRTFTLTVAGTNQPPVWTTPAGYLPAVITGDSYNYQLVATDPDTPFSFSLVAGVLPSGMSMSSSGLITGTAPAQLGDYNFTVALTDGEYTINRDFTITVIAVPNQAPFWNTPAGSLGTFYSNYDMNFQLSATDPEGNSISYSVVSGSLPSGVSMDISGLITGVLPIISYDPNSSTGAGLEQSSTFTVRASDGVFSTDRQFTITTLPLPLIIEQVTANRVWTVPANITKIMINWIIGGGGAGGWGHETGNGGGGGGGASGGYYRYTQLTVAPGDVLEFIIGGGGLSDPDLGTISIPPNPLLNYGGNGGDTFIRKNGVVVIQAGGGFGGQTSPNRGSGYLVGAGGAANGPGSVAGTDGGVGTNDYASSSGGRGAAGPKVGSVGGTGGVARGNYSWGGNVAGQPGVGYGSGGGGGGSYDRPPGLANGTYWAGGDGANGYIEFAYQSAGPTGGSS
jgi:hypothetical protein